MTAANVLLRAANAIETGRVTWGRRFFIDPASGCRCALGALTYAVAPEDLDGDPFNLPAPLGMLTYEAAELLANYLINEQGAPRCMDDEYGFDVVETVGSWNDEPERTKADVVAALRAAADQHRRHAIAVGGVE